MTTDNLGNEGNVGFHWSFKPLKICAIITTGVSVGLTKRKSLITRIFSLIFGLLIILSNLYLNSPRSIYATSFKWLKAAQKFERMGIFFSEYPDVFLQLSMDIGYMLLYLAKSFVHVIFLKVTFSSKWAQLNSTLNLIQLNMQLDGMFHRKCRKRFLFCLLIMMTDAACFMRRYGYDSIYVADERWQGERDDLGEFYSMVAISPLPYLAALWARMADICILILYAGISCMAAQMYAELEEKTSELTTGNKTIGCHQSYLKLEEIRSHYELVSALVENIDDCFGLVLLVNTARTYANSILEFSGILQTGGTFVKRYLEYGHTIIRFFIILVPSFIVAQQVSGLGRPLAGLSSASQTSYAQLQMNTILMQVSQLTAPAISALETVEIKELSEFMSFLDTSFQYGATLLGCTAIASTMRSRMYLDSRSIVNKFSCPNGEDYSPCLCLLNQQPLEDTYVDSFSCTNVTLKQIQRTFKATTAVDIKLITLSIRDSTLIPKDIFGNHYASSIYLTGFNLKGTDLLQIHPKAFRSSSRDLIELDISSYDLQLMDFRFLADFQQLRTLQIFNCRNLSLSSVPYLPRLNKLVINEIDGLKDLMTFPKPATHASKQEGMQIDFSRNKLNDDGGARILNWIHAELIVPGYNVSLVFLKNNNLTKFSSTYYKAMLEWMHDHHSKLDLYRNGFDCSDICELAWLFRDNPHLLVPMEAEYKKFLIMPPRCMNGTLFTRLSRERFQNCSKIDDDI